MTGDISGTIAARLDRLAFSASLKKLVAADFAGRGVRILRPVHDRLYRAGPGRRRICSPPTPAGFFAPDGVGFFVFCTFAGMWAGCGGFRLHRRPAGPARHLHLFAALVLRWPPLVMAFQHSAASIDLWRFIAAIGVGLEQVTIDTLLPELVPRRSRGRAFAFNQFIEFSVVPVVALLGWLLVPLHPFGLDGWRCVALIGASGALAAWWLRLAVPESPRWLALHGRGGRGRSSDGKAGGRRGARYRPCAAAAARRRSDAAGAGQPCANFCGRLMRGRTVMLSVFNLMQTIAFYGFGSWVPSLLIAKGIHVTTSLEYAFIIALANPVGPLLGFLIADRMERKWQLVCGGRLGGGLHAAVRACRTRRRW